MFISPLRRAMQTAYHTFKEHPNFKSIRFIIVPLLREIMNLASGIPYSIDKVIEEFSLLFPILDTSLFDKYEDKLHYFLYDSDQKLKEEILGKLEKKEDDVIGTNAFDLLLEKSKGIKPHKLETKLNVLQRVNKIKSYVNEYVESLDSDQKVVVVTHFFILEMWTGNWDGNPYDFDLKDVRKPTRYINFRNTLPYYYSGNETQSIQDQVEEELRKEETAH